MPCILTHGANPTEVRILREVLQKLPEPHRSDWVLESSCNPVLDADWVRRPYALVRGTRSYTMHLVVAVCSTVMDVEVQFLDKFIEKGQGPALPTQVA